MLSINLENQVKKTYLIFGILLLTSCSINGGIENKIVRIHDIQGCSHFSPYEGQKVNSVEGVVTHKLSNGFTIQDYEPDGDRCSSEGIFVFTKDYPMVMPGDLVSVSGIVAEFTSGDDDDFNLSQTEIVEPEIKIIQSDHPIPETIVIDEIADLMPLEIIDNDGMTDFDIEEDGLDFFESLESMLVEIDNGIVVASRNAYNEIVILPESLVDFNIISQSVAILKNEFDQNPERITIKLPSSNEQNIRLGDRLSTPIIGVMDYSYGSFKLLSINNFEFSPNNLGEETFQHHNQGLTIATYNLENLSLFNEHKRFTKFANQIVNNLSSPDLIILNEVMDDSGSEDDGEVSAEKNIEKLINEIRAQGGPDYLYSDSPPTNNQDGGIEGGNIRSVLLYRSDRDISLAAEDLSTDTISFIDGQFFIPENPLRIGEFSENFINSRKPTVWLMEHNGLQFIVLGVHLVSQTANSPEWGRLQPPQENEEQKRINQANFINQFVEALLREQEDIFIIIAGDMNDDPWSKTIIDLCGDDFINTAEQEQETERYSYIFEGNAQQLDYILVSNNWIDHVIQSKFLHLNTIQDHEHQVSDHDPVIIEIDIP